MLLQFCTNVLGSVIKHQLVTHLPLGIALRGVLDALRKPADSKVCVISYHLFFHCFLSYNVVNGLSLSLRADVCLWDQGVGAVCGSSD